MAEKEQNNQSRSQKRRFQEGQRQQGREKMEFRDFRV